MFVQHLLYVSLLFYLYYLSVRQLKGHHMEPFAGEHVVCIYGTIKVSLPYMFECNYKGYYVNLFVFHSNSITAGLSVTTWRTEWTSYHSPTCSSIHHTSSQSKRINFGRTYKHTNTHTNTHTHTHTPSIHTTNTHKRSRCPKERTTFKSIPLNISAEWTLLCIGISTWPMG